MSEVLAGTLDRISFPNRFLKLISQEVEAGRLEAVDPAQTVITVLGSCIYYFVAEPIIRAVLSKVQPDLTYDRAAFVASRKEEIFKVIYYGLKKREGGDAD